MPDFDSASLATILVAAASVAAAAFLRVSTGVRIALILVAALLIRLDPARQTSLHTWDEAFHAVVARHMMDDPFTPMLYRDAVTEAAADDWVNARIWLHKPPLTMWLMAVSMKVFGVSAVAMRLPGVLLSTLAVWLTFLIGRRLFNDRAALFAAGAHAVNGLLVQLAGGRRVADHVDTTLVACVALGVLLVVRRAPAHATWRTAALAGAAMGVGLLAKSFPALVVAVVAGTWWLGSPPVVSRALRLMAILTVAAAAVAAPWHVHIHAAFPTQAAAAQMYTLRHLTEVIESHSGPAWVYLADMPKFFGELVYVPLIWFVARRASWPADAYRLLLVWIAVPYVVFSVVPTKLPAFVATAAPALFLIQGAVLDRLRTLVGERTRYRPALATLLALIVVLQSRFLLEPSGVFERRDRRPAVIERFTELDREITEPGAVLFNVPRNLEAMFYSRFTVYSRPPAPGEADTLRRRGLAVIVDHPVSR